MNNAFVPTAKKPLVVIMHVQTTRMDRNFYKPLEEQGGRIFVPYDNLCKLAAEAHNAGKPVMFVELAGKSKTEKALLDAAGGLQNGNRIIISENYGPASVIFNELEKDGSGTQPVILGGFSKYCCVYPTVCGLVGMGVKVITSDDILMWKEKGNDSYHFEIDWFFLKKTRFLPLPKILSMIRA